MFIPYATDAPLYHRPWATGGLIVANLLVFMVQLTVAGFTDHYKLIHGEINPV